MAAQPLRIFVASASEGLEVANAVCDVLRGHDRIDPRIWTEDIFKLGLTYIEALEAELSKADFAVLSLTRHDQSITRGELRMAPRDNILLSWDYSWGRLGRERTFFVFDQTHDLKIPTDLLGVLPASYEHGLGDNLHNALGAACSSLAKRIRELAGASNVHRKPAHQSFRSQCSTPPSLLCRPPPKSRRRSSHSDFPLLPRTVL